MERNSSIKKAAAMCVSVMLSLCIFAGSSVVSPIKTHADNKKSATTNVYDKKLSQLENEQKRLESEIAAAQQQIDSAADNIESLKIKSAALKKQIESYKAQSLQIELEIANVDSKLREAKKKLEQQTTDIEKSTEDFMKRIRTMYIAGSANSYENILLDSQDFYDACDELGFAVWAEIPFISVMSKNPHAHQNCIEQMKELVIQNYNHPSIMFWGVSNEILIGGI